MKKKERSTAIAALISAGLGIIFFSLLLLPSYDGTDLLIWFYMIFFGLAILLSGISLLIKRNKMALIAFLIGYFFGVIFTVLVLLPQDMCVIC